MKWNRQKFYEKRENIRNHAQRVVTEKDSVSSKKQIKRQRLGRRKIDSLVEDEVIFEVKVPRIDEARALIYSRRCDKRVGLPVNFQQ